MPLRLYDPTAQAPKNQERTGAARVRSLEGLKIGLLSNGKVNAHILLNETARIFEQRHRCRVIRDEDKRDAGRPCPTEMLGRLSEAADFLITAAGD